ncbi:TIGR01906 family membrane protein [Haloimpatiens lingqiaonensis]|uniref:TIGR01906 family membrane protein n=1 Tax=Haloimpatiens lingqiaonensis TaxID=1380675 RepID=UPI001485ABD3|nr:TIGR01906 family membrane protein [Haloimpatiens lingqiaonensis]
MKNIYKIIVSILMCAIIILWSILFTIKFKHIYYFSIDKFKIHSDSSLEKYEIKNNYNYLIDYLTSNNTSEFKLPTLSSSPEGTHHFIEVKNIFYFIKTAFYVCYFSFICISLFLLSKGIRILKEALKLSSIFLLSLIGSICFSFINFQKSFDIFHNIMFKNDYWMFYPEKDPIINILPEGFFALCFFFILLLIFINSIIMLIFSRNSN